MNSKLNVRLLAIAFGAVAFASLSAGNAFAGHHFENHSFDNVGGADMGDHGLGTMNDRDHGGKDLRDDSKLVISKQSNGTEKRITFLRHESKGRLVEVIIIKRDGKRFVEVIPLTSKKGMSGTGTMVKYDLADNKAE